MELHIDNCPRCGKVYSKLSGDVCPACRQQVEEQYKLCSEYLRENRHATIHELNEGTGVSIRQITKFIREGRISLSDAPNLGYPCESCGEMIRKGVLCESCQSRLSRGVSQLRDEEMRKRERLKEEMRKAGYKIKENLKLQE